MNLIANMIWKYIPDSHYNIDKVVSAVLICICVLLVAYAKQNAPRRDINQKDGDGKGNHAITANTGIQINSIETHGNSVSVENVQGNKIIIENNNNNEKNKVEDIAIVITRHYRPDLEFSITSTGGLYEIIGLYVEAIKMYRCVPGMVRREAMYFRTKYKLILVPTIRVYPLLPPTIDSGDTWVLKEKDAELFGIEFEWPSMTAVDVVIKAEVYDHVRKNKKTIQSDTIRLQRNGESIADKEGTRRSIFADYIQGKIEFVPDDNPIQLSSYVYKIVTIDGFLESKDVAEATQLNRRAYREISNIFNTDTVNFTKIINKKSNQDLMFESTVHPSIALRLLEVSRVLHEYLFATSTQDSESKRNGND